LQQQHQHRQLLKPTQGGDGFKKRKYRAGVEASIGSSELPELDASYRNWMRVMGKIQTKVEEQDRLDYLKTIHRKCQARKYVAVRMVEVLREDGMGLEKAQVLAAKVVHCVRRTIGR
jgi:hypothetical protein